MRLNPDTLNARIHSRYKTMTGQRSNKKLVLSKSRPTPTFDARPKKADIKSSDAVMSREAMLRALDYLIEKDGSIENRISRRLALSRFSTNCGDSDQKKEVTRTDVISAISALRARGDSGTPVYQFLKTLSEKPPQGI